MSCRTCRYADIDPTVWYVWCWLTDQRTGQVCQRWSAR
jgi:hypothetical protein